MTTAPAPPSESFGATLQRVWRDPLGRVMIVLSAVMAVLLIGLVAFAVLLFLPIDRTASTPTQPFATPVLPDDALVASGDVSLVPSYPTSISINGLEYPVLPLTVGDDGSLSIPHEDETGFWVYGTIVNYAIGFDASPQNSTFLYSVRAGDAVEMTLGSGEKKTFEVREIARHARSDASVFSQNEPGLSLFLAGGVMAERLVIRAQAAGAADAAGQSPAGLNSVQSDGSVEVTLTSAESVLRPGDVPAGWTYLLVDFSVNNLSDEAVDLSQAHGLLIDSTGNQYAPTLQAVRYTSFAGLPLSLDRGQAATASMAFLLPASAGGPNLLWRFYPRQGNGGSLAFSFPYDSLASDLTVELTSAVASEDGGSVNVNGLAFNPGTVSAVIGQANVRLLTPGGEEVQLRFVDPPFPWHVPGGQTAYFTITYVMPASDVATFSLLDYHFSVGFR